MDQLEASYIDVYNLNVYPNTEFYHLIEEDVFSSKAIFRSRNSNVSTNYSVYGGTRVSSGSSEYFSKVHHAPPLPTAMHLRSCLLGIGPSATSF